MSVRHPTSQVLPVVVRGGSASERKPLGFMAASCTLCQWVMLAEYQATWAHMHQGHHGIVLYRNLVVKCECYCKCDNTTV